MFKYFFLILSLLATNKNSFAQAKSKSVLKKWNYSFTTMLGSGVTSPAIAVTQQFSLHKKKQSKFQLGFGVRFTNINGSKNLAYCTAPAKITEGNLIKPPNKANLDTIGLQSTNVNVLNAMVALNYRFTSKLNLEFNIDAAGLSFGKQQNAYLRNQAGVDSNFVTAVAVPTSQNLLLVSDQDLGSLNSELIISYKLNKHWKAKAGLGFLFTEYTFNNKTYINSQGITVSNDRFRNKATGLNIGVIYNF
jgi:hypothetical protein